MQEIDASHIDKVARDGFLIFENFLDQQKVSSQIRNLSLAQNDRRGSQRGGLTFGLRDLLNVVPETRELANSDLLTSTVAPIIGGEPRVVRAIYFDKHKDANWKVAWHQDLTIAVQKRIDVGGFGPWSVKAGITHVQPPVSVLNNMLTLRVHLDQTDVTNGALRVIPGSHLHGKLDASQIQYWKNNERIVCCSVRPGGVMLMRPLLLHSSLPSLHPEHRRVLHFEYTTVDLPDGLEWFEAGV